MLQYILKEITKLKPAVEWYFFLATLSCLSAIAYIKPVITFSVGLDFDSYMPSSLSSVLLRLVDLIHV